MFQGTGECGMAFFDLALALHTNSILLGTDQQARRHRPKLLWRGQRICKGLEMAHLVNLKSPG